MQISRSTSWYFVDTRNGRIKSGLKERKFKGTPMRELGRLYEMTMKFRTISRTRHAGRRARNRQIIKQHGAKWGWRKARKSKEERGTGMRNERVEEDAGKFPPTSHRFRPAAFLGRVPWIVKRVTRFTMRRDGWGRWFVEFPLLYTVQGTYILDKSTEVSYCPVLLCPLSLIIMKWDLKLWHFNTMWKVKSR